jgi:proteasome lid subunit RPN8/RPN11
MPATRPVPCAIPAHLREALYAHARRDFPAECCGYLTGPAPRSSDARADAIGGAAPTGPAPRPSDARADAIGGAAPTGPAPRPSDAVDAIVACRNAQSDGTHPLVPARGADAGFVISGAELFAFARSFDGPAPARVVYHSHTNGRAYLSDVDRAMAAGPSGPVYPVQHLVIGVDAQGVTEAAQFAWSDDARDFIEVARWRVDADDHADAGVDRQIARPR